MPLYEKYVVLNNLTQNPLQTYFPWTTRLFCPTTFNPDQKWFKSILSLHICLCHILWKISLWSPSACKPHNTIFVGVLSRFPSFYTILLTFPDLIQLCRLYLTRFTYSNHHFQFDSIFLIQMYSTFLVQFESISWGGLYTNISIWLSVSNLNQLFWFNCTNNFQIQFNLSFMIQFDPFIWFDSTHTAHIWLAFSTLTRLLRFNLTWNSL